MWLKSGIACLIILTTVTVQHNPGPNPVDNIVAECREETALNEILEVKYAQGVRTDETIPTLDGFQNKLLLKRAYDIAKRQRVFECVAEHANLYDNEQNGPSREEIESNASYQHLQEMCLSEERRPVCNEMYPYRSFEGTCNNLDNPNWGAILDCTKRLLPQYYESVSEPRESVNDKPLPNPRELSSTLHIDKDRASKVFTTLFAFFGQFLDHDIADSPINSIDGNTLIECCPVQKDSHPECFPIAIAEDEPFYSTFGVNCFPVVRSAPCASCTVDKRSQMNQVSAFIDASVTYGSTIEDAKSLRARDGTGKLRKQMGSRDKLLPANFEVFSEKCGSSSKGEFCFIAGDRRVNLNTPLMSLHTLLFREHNRVAEELAMINPQWDEEILYQESRKIVGASLQNIVYNEFLPPLLGDGIIQKYDLAVRKSGRSSYDPSVDPTILAEFNTVVFRLHSLINSLVSVFEVQSGRQRLREQQFDASTLYNENIGPFVKGMAKAPAQQFDRFIVTDISNFLYRELNGSFGFDLPAVNIQRGRDHGIAPYIYLAQFASDGQITIESFDDLRQLMPAGNVRRLKRIYSAVEDIDPWVGVNMEAVNKPLLMGPTMANLIGLQFMRLKKGDRFYFEHELEEPCFSDAQLASIRNTSIARIVCDNTEPNIDPAEKMIQRQALLLPRRRNPIVSCNEIPTFDLRPWKDSH